MQTEREARCVRALEAALGPSKVCVEPALLESRRRDASEVEGALPFVLVRAECAADVQATLAVCSQWEQPVFPRAAGTGKTGGAVPSRSGVVLETLGMARIKDIDRANQLVTVEPGVVLADLHAAVEAEGLFYPPDPNSLESCALGGNLAENAGGPRAFKYGVTREYVLGLEAVLMDGTVLHTGRKTVKGVTGYDVTALLVGSEGTLAVFTEATLRLVPKPPEVRTLLVSFRSNTAAARAVSAAVAQGFVPRCMELLDRECCAAIREARAFAVPDGIEALLIVELDGAGPSLDLALERLGNAFAEAGAEDVLVAQHSSDAKRFWQARRGMSLALRQRAKYKLSEDIVVPRAMLGEMLSRVGDLAARTGLRLPGYGHAGDGNLHINFLWNDPAEKPLVEHAIADVFRTTVALGGTLTGEHGLGLLKRDFLHLEQSTALMELQRRLKAVFDPKGLLNPDKMFPLPGVHRAC